MVDVGYSRLRNRGMDHLEKKGESQMNKRKKKLYRSGLSFLTASTMLIQTVGVQAQETESSSANEANTSSLPS